MCFGLGTSFECSVSDVEKESDPSCLLYKYTTAADQSGISEKIRFGWQRKSNQSELCKGTVVEPQSSIFSYYI